MNAIVVSHVEGQVNDMTKKVDWDRRRFLWRTAMAIGAAHLGMLGAAESEGSSRELIAIGHARAWLNSPRLTPEALVGKVVLVQFCTYTCINWLRTLPYIRVWTQKYGSDVVVLGVHTPEFAFEQNVDNVRRALQQMRVMYPVVIDNDYAIWRAFDNHYWPALYFVDARGRVRQHHFGEGEYERSEKVIQRLLAEAGGAGSRDRERVSVDGNGVEAPADWANLRSPEIYLGFQRTEHFTSPGGIRRDRRRPYVAADRLALNQWTLAGDWTIGPQAAVLNSLTGRVACRFHARDLHLVMGPSTRESQVRFRVSIDGQPPGTARGDDIDAAGNGTVVEQRLYQLIRQPRPIVDRRFEIEFIGAGVETFAFTFG
jgi:Thioredoxin like C-terminal domain